jgi:Cu/Ag efflux protein CusF
MKSIQFIAALTLGVVTVAPAQTVSDPAAIQSSGPSGTAASTTNGEVRKVDREQGKLTLKHGPIANLEMPGMTMVFKVADPKMLDSVKEGDKVRFEAAKVNGAITVTAIEAVK